MGLFGRKKKKNAGDEVSFPREIQVLREDGGEEAIGQLMQMAKEGPEKKQALYALLTMDAPQAAQLMRDSLGEYAYGDAVKIAHLLLKAPCEALYDAVLDVYLQQYYYIRNELIRFIGKDKDIKAARALIAFMGDDESYNEAREMLGEIAPERMEEGLKNAYMRGNGRTRLMVSHQLMALGGVRAVEALAFWDWGEDFDAMMEGAANLALLYDEEPEAVDGLLEGDPDEKAAVVLAAGLRLGRYEGDSAARTALDSGDSARRYVGARTLRDMEQVEDRTQVMCALLEDTDERVRRVSILYFTEHPEKAALGGLARSLSSADELTRRQAALALGALGDRAAVQPLIGLLNDGETRVRAAGAEALGMLKSRAAVDALLALLQDEEAVVRQMAAQALGEIGDKSAVDSLMKALHDDDIDVVKAVNASLARMQTDNALK